ncbi:MAG: hypothetical protein AAF703_00350 [Cyanobacteria bacterium P01_D01_bin.105]
MRCFTALFFAATAALSVSSAVSAQRPVAHTPLTGPLEMTGVSGGRESSVCGNIDRSAGQTISVTEMFASLSFAVEGEGDYTLLITGPNGFRECVFAHNYDGGVIQAPGLLNQGQYRVFIGDRKGESHPYTLSITQ